MPRVALTRADREAAAIDREVKRVTGEFLDCLYIDRGRGKKTKDDIAKEFGVTRQTISNWEKGNVPGVRLLVTAAYKLGHRLELRPTREGAKP